RGAAPTANAAARSLPAVPPPGWRGRGGAASRVVGRGGRVAPAHTRSSRGGRAAAEGSPPPTPAVQGWKGGGGGASSPTPAFHCCSRNVALPPGFDLKMSEKAPATDFLRVTEIFHSVQGESTWAGLPCTFVRLTGCPLRCVWCDRSEEHTSELQSRENLV